MCPFRFAQRIAASMIALSHDTARFTQLSDGYFLGDRE